MRYFCVIHGWDTVSEPCRRCLGPRPHDWGGVLQRAIVASVKGDARDIGDLFTPDVAGSGPATKARSREELAIEIDRRAAAFTRPEVTFGNVARRGDSVRL